MVAAAFFDVDRTILDGSSLLTLARPLRHAGLLPLPLVVSATLRQLWYSTRGYDDTQLDRAALTAANAAAGLDAGELRRIGSTALPRVVMPRVYREAHAAIAAHKRRGEKVFLVSSAPIEIVSELGKLLGADDIAATVSEVGADGRYTGRITSFCHGEAKADAVRDLAARHSIDLLASTAYGDALSDLPMLSLVGRPIAVNPDSRLRAVAAIRGWEIRRFTHRLGGPARLGAAMRLRRQQRPGRRPPAPGKDGVG